MNDSSGLAALVLCGGQSHRMRQAKYRLPFFGETLLRRICRIAGTVASPILIVAAADQDFSQEDLPLDAPSIGIVRDPVPYSGPLAGIAQGLQHLCGLEQSPVAVFVTSCDVPLLNPALIRMLGALLIEEFDAVVIRDGQFSFPLCAVYRTTAVNTATSLLIAGQRRAGALPEALRTRWVALEEVRTVDPELDSLRNCNTPEDYERLIRDASPPFLATP